MWRRNTESSVNKIFFKFLECNLKMGHTSVKTYICMLRVKIKFRLKFFSLGWFSISFVS